MKTAAHFPTLLLRKVACPYCAHDFGRDCVQETSMRECAMCGEQFQCVVHEDGMRSTYFVAERVAR